MLYSKWVTNKDLLYSAENSTHCYVPAWMGGGFEGEWTHVYGCMYGCVCICCPLETATTLLMGYTSVQNKKLKKKKKGQCGWGDGVWLEGRVGEWTWGQVLLGLELLSC